MVEGYLQPSAFNFRRCIDTPTEIIKKTFTTVNTVAQPGSAEEKEIFNNIRQRFKQQFKKIFPDKLAPRTVVIIPSLSLDEEILQKITGHIYYEERLLCLLMHFYTPLLWEPIVKNLNFLLLQSLV